MEKRWATVLTVLIILAFVLYITFDLVLRKDVTADSVPEGDTAVYTESWTISAIYKPVAGQLKAVSVMPGGDILLGGESFISRYTTELREQWTISTQSPVTAITAKGSNIYASTQGTILLLGADGRIIQEWGPYADSSVITSVTATDKLVAFADAGTRKVYIFDTGGELRKIIGAEEQGFILPSHYFDAAFGTDNTLYIANTGKLRIEKWTTDGEMSGSFGESGLAPGAFCGCCNPSHFAPLPQGGFVTAEKGINRIKILDGNGNFIEFVSVNNKFMASVPLDVVAAADGGAIYAANPADSKLYIFKRNN